MIWSFELLPSLKILQSKEYKIWLRFEIKLLIIDIKPYKED